MLSDVLKKQYEKYPFMGTTVIFMKLFTFYPIYGIKGILIKLLYRLYGFFILFGICGVAAQTLITIFQIEDLDFVVNGLAIVQCLSNVCGCLNLVYFRSRPKKLVELTEKMNEIFLYSSEESLNTYSMKRRIKIVALVTCFWTIPVLLQAAAVCIFVPVTAKTRTLAVPAWYPYDWSVSPIFESTVVYQTVVNTFIASTYCMSDLYVFSLIACTVGQFRILGHNIKNLYTIALLKFKCSEEAIKNFCNTYDDQVPAIKALIANDDFRKRLEEDLGRCVELHKVMLDYCKDIEDFCAPLLFIKVQMSFMLLVFITYCLVAISEQSLKFTIVYGMYWYGAFVELCIYTISGQMLLSESEIVRQNLYDFPWYISNERIKKAVLMMQLRCKDPPKITAGKIIIMNVETLMAIVKTSYSYYTILSQTMAKSD